MAVITFDELFDITPLDQYPDKYWVLTEYDRDGNYQWIVDNPESAWELMRRGLQEGGDRRKEIDTAIEAFKKGVEVVTMEVTDTWSRSAYDTYPLWSFRPLNKCRLSVTIDGTNEYPTRETIRWE